MRIEDDDLIRILKRDGPASASYVAQELKAPDQKKRISKKLRSLVKYSILERIGIGSAYFYKIPGDTRPFLDARKTQDTARNRLNEHIREIPEGHALTPPEVASLCGCSLNYAQRILRRSGLKKTVKIGMSCEWTKGGTE